VGGGILYQFVFGLANVQRGKVDTVLCFEYFGLAKGLATVHQYVLPRKQMLTPSDLMTSHYSGEQPQVLFQR